MSAKGYHHGYHHSYSYHVWTLGDARKPPQMESIDSQKHVISIGTSRMKKIQYLTVKGFLILFSQQYFFMFRVLVSVGSANTHNPEVSEEHHSSQRTKGSGAYHVWHPSRLADDVHI